MATNIPLCLLLFSLQSNKCFLCLNSKEVHSSIEDHLVGTFFSRGIATALTTWPVLGPRPLTPLPLSPMHHPNTESLCRFFFLLLHLSDSPDSSKPPTTVILPAVFLLVLICFSVFFSASFTGSVHFPWSAYCIANSGLDVGMSARTVQNTCSYRAYVQWWG